MISIIIPARNEAHNIASAILAASRAIPRGFQYELVVVDNGSTDATSDIAASLGAKVLHAPGHSLGALRNLGVRESHGDIIVFLDADVVLTDDWCSRFADTVRAIEANYRIVTGSLCVVPDDPSLVEHWWFAKRRPEATSHIGSGHLIVSRRFFLEIGGFSETLRTGEDVAFCECAVENGGTLAVDPALRAIHMGFPSSLKAFVLREAWHGQGDVWAIRAIARSPVALVTTMFVALHGAIAVGVVLRLWTLVGVGVLCLAAICVAFSIHRYRHAGVSAVLINSIFSYFYFFGRSLALLRISAGRNDSGRRSA